MKIGTKVNLENGITVIAVYDNTNGCDRCVFKMESVSLLKFCQNLQNDDVDCLRDKIVFKKV